MEGWNWQAIWNGMTAGWPGVSNDKPPQKNPRRREKPTTRVAG